MRHSQIPNHKNQNPKIIVQATKVSTNHRLLPTTPLTPGIYIPQLSQNKQQTTEKLEVE